MTRSRTRQACSYSTSLGMTEVRIAHSYWQPAYISRCTLSPEESIKYLIMYMYKPWHPFLNTVHLHHTTVAWRWCLVRRWPPVAVWDVCRDGWALGHGLKKEGKREKENIRTTPHYQPCGVVPPFVYSILSSLPYGVSSNGLWLVL